MHFSKPWLALPFWDKGLQNSGFEITHHTRTAILRDVSLKIAATTWHLDTKIAKIKSLVVAVPDGGLGINQVDLHLQQTPSRAPSRLNRL